MTRRRHRVADEQPLGPEDDPYLAYLIWREQRDAEAPAEQVELAGVVDRGTASDRTAASDHAAAAGPARPSWLRRLTDWRRHDDSAT